MADDGEEKATTPTTTTALFPILTTPEHTAATATVNTSPQNISAPQWLSNTSFTADIHHAVSSQHNIPSLPSDEEADQRGASPRYGLLNSDGDSDSETKKRKRKKRPRMSADVSNTFAARKPSGRFWDKSGSAFETASSKDYIFDSRGDPNNLAFGSLYRMDVARYKHYASIGVSGNDLESAHGRLRKSYLLDKDNDLDQLEIKLKSSGRYWSAKYTALDRHRSLRRLRILAFNRSDGGCLPEDFVPLENGKIPSEAGSSGTIVGVSTIEESWEDELVRKTKEFNTMTREHPHNIQAWLEFAEFQDKVASMQPQKGARLQTLEKKISILEKAVELNSENIELLLCLLATYKKRDTADVLVGRWEKVLAGHSNSYKLWTEFLHVVQQEFSKFKVSDARKMYAHAIQALSAACTRQYSQASRESAPLSADPALIQLELSLVDMFVGLCHFECQAGYQELSTALFQAELEYSMFCPPLLLTEQSKQRLFAHFWNSDGARIGEEGAVGWSIWLEKEEVRREQLARVESPIESQSGGWTGWSEPFSNHMKVSDSPADAEVDDQGGDVELETDDTRQEDDTEALLKMLGIDAGSHGDGEVNDASTWARWSIEELYRDSTQWMPVRFRNDNESAGATSDMEADEQLMRNVVFEDISEYLFSLNTAEARLSLVYQFVEFFGGNLSQQICTNSSSWVEKLSRLETVPESVMQELLSVHDALAQKRSKRDDFHFESFLSDRDDISKRTSMMKFLRNATLLCLTVLPRNYVLEEALLVAEDLYHTKMNTCSSLVTPCRALAKSLLKRDRQDILLCGVYARREAAFGNIDYARRVFDMALSSVEVLPADLKNNTPLLYFWYADMELSNCNDNNRESALRAMHILSCLGTGVAYSPFKSPPSAPQLLRARQGFKDHIRNLRSTWARGVIHESSIAFICSAALFEAVNTCTDEAEVIFIHAFSTVFPERRRQSHHLEHLFHRYLRILKNHRKPSGLSKLWGAVLDGLELYPFSAELFRDLVEIGHLYTVPHKMRRIFDDLSRRRPSIMLWLFTICYEIGVGGSQHRILGLFERALAHDQFHSSVILWRWYIAYLTDVTGDLSAAKRFFFRAIHTCPWSKKLWLDGFLKLNSVLTAKEMSDLQEVMRDKELNLRTDIYEILLQDEFKK
uniref:Protein NRDE2 homolog n=1 Tax=Kalanchoe fedtschenkoi TaxID=63787 RepID=A0A7N0UFL9_KALFE